MTDSTTRLILGCGYLGLRVARAWRRSGDRVVALTRAPENAERLHAEGIESIVGDVMQPATLAELPAADTVLYAVGFDRAAGFSKRAVAVQGLRNVLEVLAGRVGRLIYISSTSVYGQSAGEWVDESSPCHPSSENGRVVLDAELVVSSFFPPEEDRARVLRLAGIYGPDRLLRRVELLRAREAIAGDPRAWLNLVHVDDAVRVVLACAGRDRAGPLYLVCDDRPVTRQEYFTKLAELVAAPPPVFSGEPGVRTVGLNKRCCNRRLREELRVELAYPTIDSGLRHAVAAQGGHGD